MNSTQANNLNRPNASINKHKLIPHTPLAQPNYNNKRKAGSESEETVMDKTTRPVQLEMKQSPINTTNSGIDMIWDVGLGHHSQTNQLMGSMPNRIPQPK